MNDKKLLQVGDKILQSFGHAGNDSVLTVSRVTDAQAIVGNLRFNRVYCGDGSLLRPRGGTDRHSYFGPSYKLLDAKQAAHYVHVNAIKAARASITEAVKTCSNLEALQSALATISHVEEPK